MLEARLLQGGMLKKIIESIRELVVDANLDCDESGISMQVRSPTISIKFTHHLLLSLILVSLQNHDNMN